MPLPVKLRDVSAAIESQSDGMECKFLIDRKTGEIAMVLDEMADAVENDDEDESRHDWQKEDFALAKRVLASPDFIEVPNQRTVHEYNLMAAFAGGIADDNQRDYLELALTGKGSFRRFKDALRRKGLEQAWYAMREAAYLQAARDFLDAEGIAWEA